MNGVKRLGLISMLFSSAVNAGQIHAPIPEDGKVIELVERGPGESYMATAKAFPPKIGDKFIEIRLQGWLGWHIYSLLRERDANPGISRIPFEPIQKGNIYCEAAQELTKKDGDGQGWVCAIRINADGTLAPPELPDLLSDHPASLIPDYSKLIPPATPEEAAPPAPPAINTDDDSAPMPPAPSGASRTIKSPPPSTSPKRK